MSTGTDVVDMVYNTIYNQMSTKHRKEFGELIYFELIGLLNTEKLNRSTVKKLCRKYGVISAPALLYL